jgi:hypothetical protein
MYQARKFCLRAGIRAIRVAMDKVKYDMNDPRLAPRRTKPEIPGWAGTQAARQRLALEIDLSN